MTNRAQAITYAVIVMCAVALGFLILHSPSGAHLAIAIGLGTLTGVGWYLYLERH